MTTRRHLSREELQAMRRADLQKIAKDYHIKANLKTDALVDEILRVRAVQAPPRQQGSIQPRSDERENVPQSKSGPSTSRSTASPDRARKVKEVQGRLGVGKASKPTSNIEGTRKVPSETRPVIPPGVVAAAHADTSKGKSRIPSLKKGIYPKQMRRIPDSMALVKGSSLTSLSSTESPDTDTIMRTPRMAGAIITSQPSSDLRLRDDPTLVERLDKRVKTLEDENETNAKELKELRSDLHEAQENIAELREQNEQLRLQLEALDPTNIDQNLTNIFSRLNILESVVNKDVSRQRGASISSSEADLYTPPVRKTEVQTPPNQIGLRSHGGTLRPPFTARESARRPTPLHHAVGLARLINPDESPSPTRRQATLPLSAHPEPTKSDIYAINSTYTPPNLPLHAVERPKQSASVPKPTRKSLKSEDELIMFTPDTSSDSRRPQHSRKNSKKSDYGLAPIGTPKASSSTDSISMLPHPIVATPIRKFDHTTVPPSASRSVHRSSKSVHRNHPYSRKQIEHNGSESPDPISATITQPLSMRDIFGSTPDPTRVPPLPIVDAKIPVLNLGATERSRSVTLTPEETPQLSPVRPSAIVQETPPASRTLYGTEFGSAMRARFSDNDSTTVWKSK